ncbi:MAG TPA: hypothetical protein DCZ95_01615 [Verrucomicrobia bacterium]|nr:MAG: hypothetical protein A2X46_08650 [Lentisphaerae bacterium GWF2_57_35]HBA82767.1 hypothetical protein [Verrucomicrobiota bacterium]
MLGAWILPGASFAAEKKAEPAKVKKETAVKAPEAKTAEKTAPVTAKADAEKKATTPVKQVSQAELAQLLVNVLGLARFIPASPSAEQCFGVLMANSIVPAEGWVADKVVTKADLARIIVQSMKRQSEVKNPDDPKSWIDYLKSIGVPIDTIGQAVDNVNPLAEPVAPNVVTSSSDPMAKRHKFNTIDETQYGVDMLSVARVFSQLELDAGEFRPLPITQD